MILATVSETFSTYGITTEGLDTATSCFLFLGFICFIWRQLRAQRSVTSMGKLYLFNLVIDNPPHINYVTTVPCNLLLIRPTSLVCGGRTFSDIHVPRGSDIV